MQQRYMIGVDPDTRDRLGELAEATHRTIVDVVRVLAANAKIVDPDVVVEIEKAEEVAR